MLSQKLIAVADVNYRIGSLEKMFLLVSCTVEVNYRIGSLEKKQAAFVPGI